MGVASGDSLCHTPSVSQMDQNVTQDTPPQSSPQRLKQSLVTQALKTFYWDKLKQHLSTVDLGEESVTELLSYILRSSDFLIKRPDEVREAARTAFIEKLAEFLVGRLGADAAALLGDQNAVIRRIEAGYREILRTQEATLAAKLLPEAQASAAVSRAAYSYHELSEAINSSARRRKVLTLQSFRIKRPDGSSYSLDGVLASIVDITTMTLMLLGHRYEWFDAQKFLVLPKLPDVTDDEVYKAGLTEVLAASWRHWERMEQRCRYFGGEIKASTGSNLPTSVPQGTEIAIEYDHVSSAEFFDYLANERLNDRLIQTYQEMALETNMQAKELGIAGPLSLPPGAFVSAREAHADFSLSEDSRIPDR